MMAILYIQKMVIGESVIMEGSNKLNYITTPSTPAGTSQILKTDREEKGGVHTDQ
jgi:hypothetical protein